MLKVAIISQKGGAGKTTLATNLACAGQEDGKTSLVIDLDPQASSWRWGELRNDKPPQIIDSAPPVLSRKLEGAEKQGAEFVVIDTAGSAERGASTAVRNADIVIIPCRPAFYDVDSIGITIELAKNAGTISKNTFIVFNAGRQVSERMYEDIIGYIKNYGVKVSPIIIPARNIFNHSALRGMSVMEMDETSKAAEEIRELYCWILKETKKD